jgi:ABC-type sugar transport system substrate-binding protein
LGKKLGLPVDVLTSEANSQKQFADLKAEIAKTGGNMVVSVDPNEAPDVVPIAKMLESAGVYWVNWWNKPPDVKVADYPHWVSHVAFDAVGQGYWNAKQLFKSFKTPNKGKIIAIQGMLANNAAIGRFQGLQKALKENPGVQLLQWESAEWDTTKAYNATKALLAAHPDVDGVWSANDNMAMGAIQALKEAGLAGKVLVTGTDGNPEAFDAIKAGTMASTEFQDSRYQAQLGLTMALAAKDGKLDVKKLPAKHRSWLIPGVQVNRENVDKFVNDYIKSMPTYDLSDFFKNWKGEAP